MTCRQSSSFKFCLACNSSASVHVAQLTAEQDRLHAVIDTTFSNSQAVFAAGCCIGVTYHSAESGLQCFS